MSTPGTADLRKFEDRFGGMRSEYLFLTQLIPIVLLSRIQEGVLYRLCFKSFGALDTLLYAVLPFLRKYSWCIVFSVSKPTQTASGLLNESHRTERRTRSTAPVS